MRPIVDRALPVEPGQTLLDKYEVDGVVGSGGMGVVLSAKHLVLGERVALKFLTREASEKPELRARFLREAQAAARIRCEQIARVHDAGTLPDGTPFVVMELLEGRDLADTIRGEGPMPPDRAVDCVLQACEGLAHAHALGIVHRDLKPSNMFLVVGRDGERRLKLLDFGISKVDAVGEEPSLTASHAVIGSPLYMSPEQVRASKHVDARADVWALGVVLHELLSGTTPFRGDTASALFASIAADPPEPLARAAPGAPTGLRDVVAGCLEKDPDRRFRSVAELAVALEPFGTLRGVAARVAKVLDADPARTLDPTAPAPPVGATLLTATDFEQPEQGRRATRPGWVVAVAGVVAILAAVWATTRPDGRLPPRPVEASTSPARAAEAHPSVAGSNSAADPRPVTSESVEPPLPSAKPSRAVADASVPRPSQSLPLRASASPKGAGLPLLPSRKEF